MTVDSEHALAMDMETAHETVQLRYMNTTRKLDSLEASDVSAVLQGVVSLVEACAEAGVFGELQDAPDVRVRAPKDGSVILETVVTFMQNYYPELIVGSAPTAIGAAGWGLRRLLRKLRGDLEDFDHLSNGNVKLIWKNGDVEEITADEWTLLNNEPKKTKKALQRILAPLEKDADRLEARSITESDADPEPVVIATHEDYIAAHSDETVVRTPYETSLVTKVHMFRFKPRHRWGITTSDGVVTATMEDEEFASKLESGLRVSEEDEFTLDLRIEPGELTGSQTDKYRILKVRFHRPGGGSSDEPPLPGL